MHGIVISMSLMTKQNHCNETKDLTTTAIAYNSY